MSVGLTQYGVPVYPGDCADWSMDGGYLQSPTCIADRAAEMAAKRAAAQVRSEISAVEERLDMTDIPDVKKDTTVGDLKLTVNKIKAKVGGKTVPTVLSCFLAVMSFAGEIGVWKANINDVGDSEIVTNVTVTGSFISSATQLTEKVEFFNDLRTNRETEVTAAFSNAVNGVMTVRVGSAFHETVGGTASPLVKDSGGTTFVSASESSGGLQRTLNVDKLHIRDLTDIWIGGTETDGSVYGGETAYGAIRRMTGVTLDDVTVTNASSSGAYIGTVKVSDREYPLYAPNGTTVTQVQKSGTEIASVTVGSETTKLYVPDTVSKLGNSNGYIDSNIEVHTGSQWNTKEWDVYYRYTDYLPYADVFHAQFHTNFLFTLSLTNLATSVSPSYEWWKTDTNGCGYVEGLNVSPASMYIFTSAQAAVISKDIQFTISGQYSSGGSYGTVLLISATNITDTIVNGNVILFSGTNNTYCRGAYLAVRRQPYYASTGRVVSKDELDSAIGNSIGVRSEIRGSGSFTNSYIKYDGTVSRARFETVTNSTVFFSPYRHNVSATNDIDSGADMSTASGPNDPMYLYPSGAHSWTGTVYVSSLYSGMGGTIRFCDLHERDGLYSAVCTRSGYTTLSGDYAEFTTFSNGLKRLVVKYTYQGVDYPSYVVLRDCDEAAPQTLFPDEKTTVGGIVISNDLSDVAFSGLKATNELTGTMVDIEPYTTDGSTILWRVK